MTECRLGGCGPVAVMRTGLHLGGGPVFKRPAPTLPVRPPWAHFGHRQRPRGHLVTTGDARWSPLGGGPSGILCVGAPAHTAAALGPGIPVGYRAFDKVASAVVNVASLRQAPTTQ